MAFWLIKMVAYL